MKPLSNRFNKILETKDINIELDKRINDYLLNQDNNINTDIVKEFLAYINIDDKELIKDYSLNKIDKLDINTYIENEYYKNIKIDKDIIYKKWTIKYSYYSPYQVFIYKDITINKDNYYSETNYLGYFSTSFKYLEVLEGDTTWMSITPHEINTMEDSINVATGNILVLGLGLGYYPYMISNKDSVKDVTIIELDKDVIDIFNRFILPQFKYKNKIHIINMDAIKYLKETNLNIYNYIFIDLYHNPIDGLPFYLEISKLEDIYKDITFSYWIKESILALKYRYLISLKEELYNGSTYKDYIDESNIDNKIMKILYNEYKDIDIKL
ncbi:MAG: hypothetical protein WCR97_01000 [Bacilli bacterium]